MVGRLSIDMVAIVCAGDIMGREEKWDKRRLGNSLWSDGY